MLEDFGETVTLRRLGSPNVDVTVLAKEVGTGDPVSTGPAAQFRRHWVISDKEIADAAWDGPPKRGDQLLHSRGTATIQAATEPLAGVLHRLETIGA